MPNCLLAVGSNLGTRQATIQQAIEEIGTLATTRVTACSKLYETPPVGGPRDQPPYLNGALTITTQLPPIELLEALRTIEEKLGRQRGEVWGPRAIDLDLLLYDQQIIVSELLVVPHPRMTFRRFVLEPAVEIAGQWQHPLLGTPLSALWERLTRGDDSMVLYGGDAQIRDWHAGRLLLAHPALRSVTQYLANDDYAPQVGDTCWLSLNEDPLLTEAAPRLAIFFTQGECPTLPGVPTLMLPNERREDRLFDLQGAVEAVWPQLGGQTL